MTTTPSLGAPAAVRALDARLGGRVVHRGAPGYAAAAASAFPNHEVPWTPEVVVVPDGVADVMAATAWASEQGLRVAMRAGGVGWSGAPAGSLLLDLRALDGVWVDPARRRVRVQGGAIWRDVHRELAAYGLAAAGPQFPLLGVAGHVLGGGHGWLSSRLGWASDTLLSADVVSADGRLLHVDAEHHPELFWALRGAGHDFGVVVGLELGLMSLQRVQAGAIWFHPDGLVDGLERYRAWVVDAPDDVTTIVSVAHPPPDLPLPDDVRGRPMTHVILCHCGSSGQATADLAGLRSGGGIVADTVRDLPWPELAMGNQVFAGDVHRRSNMRYTRALGDELIAVTAERCAALPALSFMSTHYYGGAIRRGDEHATAMSHRDLPWNYMVSTTWAPGEDGGPPRAWIDDYLRAITPLTDEAYYVNYLFDEPQHVAAAFNPASRRRLRELKDIWDPDRLFVGKLDALASA